jgi:hypothetical protein
MTAMASIHWAQAVSGIFSTPGDWVGGKVPGEADDAFLDPAGTNYIVTYNAEGVLAGLRLAANATMELKLISPRAPGPDLTISGAVVNAGTIRMDIDSTLTLTGTFSGGGEITLAGSISTSASPALITGSFTNLDNTIVDGSIGNWTQGQTTVPISNGVKGVLLATGGQGMMIDTGAIVDNAGTIEVLSAAGGDMLVDDPVNNSGRLIANRGIMNIVGAVTGNGFCEILNGGTLDAISTFSENVYFKAGGGQLSLTLSQSYSGIIDSFSTSGDTTLNLSDITFKSSGEATFVEDKHGTGGVLTVTDGTRTAHIRMLGDYTGDTFVASLGPHGKGTSVAVEVSASQATGLTAAMASFGPPAFSAGSAGATVDDQQSLFLTPGQA